VWSVGAIILKFVRVKFIKSPIGYMIIAAPATLFSLAFLFFGKFQFPSIKMMIYIFIAMIAALIGYWVYLKAIHEEEISRIVILQGLGPLVMLILASIFIREVLTIKDYLAFPLIIVGSILISFKKTKKRFSLSHGLKLILLSIFLFSVHSLLLKIVAEVDFTSMMILRQFFYLFMVILIVIFSKQARNKAIDDLKQLDKKKISLIYVAEILGMGGMAFFYLAIQRGPVSLVSLVGGTQCLFVLVFVTLISIFFPKILKEEVNKKTIIIKIISIILMLIGLYLISQ